MKRFDTLGEPLSKPIGVNINLGYHFRSLTQVPAGTLPAKASMRWLATSFALLVTMVSVAWAEGTAKLCDGDRLAILGDSITEQTNYSVLINVYLLDCQLAGRLQAAQFGWGGETSWGLQSVRYPFQAPTNADPLSVYAAMSLVPFEEQLNRFQLHCGSRSNENAGLV
ncbi:MAG: hypothetical protein ACTHM6_06250 [Tepidisphaeraceae bacterium]